jgi:single-strand DNA-binding protein
MPNYAQATIIGHLGRDPETRQTQGGTVAVTTSIATSRKRGGEETTTWWKITIWGTRGESFAQYLGKGDPVLVTGEPFMESWSDHDGHQRQTLSLNVSDWAFVGGGERKEAPARPQGRRATTPPKTQKTDWEDDGDDIPF